MTSVEEEIFVVHEEQCFPFATSMLTPQNVGFVFGVSIRQWKKKTVH
jgi:hypothetical protein